MIGSKTLTIGSLFDGIGGFPYAATFFGIVPVWASEIEPAAISVTRRHLPDMAHVGDITQIHGGELPPVDIITFGSPCQGLSHAGKRKGFADERSGLFTEAIRIIREMREATNGKYPTWAVWENVPGALSSGKPAGADFRAALAAFTEAEIPVPASGKWANAGMVRGGRADIAWVVYNAQHFGTAQRRRRLFLVTDFGGERAGEILFIPKSLRGYFAAGGTPRQGAAAYAAGGAGGQVGVINDQGGNSINVEKGEISPTLRSQAHGNHPVVARPICLNTWDTQQSRVFTEDGPSPTMAGADGGGGRNPAGLICRASALPNAEMEENLCPTLTCYHDQPIICGAVGVHQNGHGEVTTSDTAYSLTTSGNASARNAPLVAHPEVAGTLLASGAGLSRPGGMASETDLCIVTPEAIPINDKATRYKGGGPTRKGDGAGNGLGVGKPGDPAPTITVGDRHAVCAVETAYCLQGNKSRRGVMSNIRGGIMADKSYPLMATDRHVVAAVDCRNFRESEEVSGTLQAKESGGYSLNCQNPVRTGYTVRRLTPTECERLQGFPDGWTAQGHDGKPISDSKRYQMLGNAVAVPCVAYILMGIAQQYTETRLT